MPKSMEFEEEKDPMFGRISVTKPEQLPPEEESTEKEKEKSMVEGGETIYIFPPEKKEGLKILVKEVNGKYVTDVYSISGVKWDNNINTMPILLSHDKAGSKKPKTFIVSDKEFQRILTEISKHLTNDEIVISITNIDTEIFENTDSIDFNQMDTSYFDNRKTPSNR